MSNVFAIFRREFVAYFGQPLAYIALCLFVGLLAIPCLLVNDVLTAGVADMRVPFFWIAAAFVLLVPAVTMRLIAEERRTGSIEILCTLPVTEVQIILGKWGAAVAMVGIALVLTFSYPIAMSLLGSLDWGPVLGGYLGLFLMGSTFAAIGLAASCLSRFQLVAFLLSVCVCGLPWAFGFVLAVVPAEWVGWVQYSTFQYHFANLARGILDTRSVVFFLSVALVSLRVAVFSLERRRLS